LFAFVLILIAIAIWAKHLSRSKKVKVDTKAAGIKKDDHAEFPVPPIQVKDRKVYFTKNSITFFGGFQILDKDGVEISKQFSPLLKELFLLIFFNSQDQKKGISIEMLNQVLWFDKDSSQARNNRSVNMSKLRHITSFINGLNLYKKDGYWKIQIQTDILKVDYLEVQDYLQYGRILPGDIHAFLSIIRKGGFLIDLNYDWLDKIKSGLTNDILDLLFDFSKSNKVDYDCNIKIADAIFVHDSLNEVALKIKYNALVAMGRHHLAKTVLEQFKVEYLTLYGEPFKETLGENNSL
jgi:DNA-binding SARP family transcriptional activator